jgi:hypothetical protein
MWVLDAVFAFHVWRTLARGELPTFRNGGGYIRRSDNPSMFWSGLIILVLMLAAFGLATAWLMRPSDL